MSLPIPYRKAALDTVRRAVLGISGGSDYVHTVTTIQPALLSADQVPPDKTPWVTVYVGDSTWTDEGVDLGTQKLRFDVVIASILRPDAARDGGADLADKAVDFIGDMEKALALFAYSYVANGVTCAKIVNQQVGVEMDDQGAFVVLEHVVTYESYGVIGE